MQVPPLAICSAIRGPLEVPEPQVGNTHSLFPCTHTHTRSIVDVAPFIWVSSDWEADGASSGPTLQIGTIRPRSLRGAAAAPGTRFYTSVRCCFFFCFFFLPPLPILSLIFLFWKRVVAVSMQPHRRKDSRTTWTNGQLLLYQCTLYLFIAFSRELKSSAAGEKHNLNFFFLRFPLTNRVG